MVTSMPGWVDPPRGEDLPYDDGEPLESLRHRHQMSLLIECLRTAWRGRAAFVAGNMAVYFSSAQARNNDFRAPDFFVVKDVDPKERKSWVVWEEDGRAPDFVVELLSESTEAVDRGRKMEIYARVLKVPEYVLFDPWTQVFEFYRLHPETHAYARVEPDASGRVHSTELGYALGLWEGEYLEIRCPWLRFFDDGELVPTAAEAAQRQAEVALRDAEAALRDAEAAQRQAEVALRDAEAAETRAARLEARLREHGLDPDD